MTFISAKSSNLNFADDPHQTLTLEDGYNEFSIAFFSPLQKEVTYKWKLVENTLQEEWDYSLCDFGNCYFSIPDSGKMVSITKEQAEFEHKGYFKLTINGMNIGGTGTLKLYVYDGDDIEFGDTLSFTVVNNVTANLTDLALEGVSLYPNPAESQVQIKTKAGDHITFISSLGLEVEHIEIHNGSAVLNISEWESGIYFYYIETKEGLKSKASVLIVQ